MEHQQDTESRKMRYLGNALSLGMLGEVPEGQTVQIEVSSMTIPEVVAWMEQESYVVTVGHTDTAQLFTALLGRSVLAQRTSVTLKRGDEMVVGQYIGSRLPEGATSLPEGAKIAWMHALIR
jgi:hypothetical protein